MAYTYEEFKKRRAAEKQSVSAADTGSAAKTQRSGYTYDEFKARRQERLRAEEEKKATQPLEDAYREESEQAKSAAEAANNAAKRAGNIRGFASPQARDEYLKNSGYDGLDDLYAKQKEAQEKADFYNQYPTYADLQKYLEEEEKKAQKKAARFTEYTDEAGKAAWEKYQSGVKKDENSDLDNFLFGFSHLSSVNGINPSVLDTKKIDDAKKKYGEPAKDWTDDERLRFAYLNERDPEDAAEYAREINAEHASKVQEEEKAWREDFATSGGGGFIATTAETVFLGGVYGWADYLGMLYDPEFKKYMRGLSPYDASSAGVAKIAEKLNEKGTISEDVPIIGGKGLGDAYQLINSILQSTVYGVIGTLTGSQIMTFIGFFGQAAAGGINEAKAKGATDEQAVIYGTIAGFFEGLFEEVSLDKIWKMSSPTVSHALIKNLLRSSTIEASEEFATTMADAVAEAIILGEKSDLSKEGLLKVLEGAIYDAVAGFVSGAAQGGASTLVKAASTVQAGKNVTPEERASLKENIAKLSETAEGKKKIDIPTDSKFKLINDYTSGAMLEAFADLYGYEGKKNIFGKIKTPYENRIKDALTSFGKTSQMSEEAIKDLTDGFDGTLDADVYAKGFYDYYNAGKSGVSFDKVSTAASGELRGAAAAIAYNDGRIAGIEAGMQKTAATAENVDVVKGTEETAKAGQDVESEASSGRTAISWAFGENGRRVYSGAGAAAPAIYDDAMFRVYADAYAGKSDAAIFETAKKLYGDAVSEDAISDMIEAAIADRAEKKTVKIVRREGKVNFEGVKLNAEEKQALSALAQFAGVDIDFADLGDANGRYADGKITIDANAENPLAVVLGHEAFHRFRELAPSEAEVIERLAYEAATNEDPDAVRKVVEKYTSRTGAAFSIGDAVEEIAADYMGDIVESPEKLSALIKLANTKKKKSALARFVAWVRERWENFKSRRNGETSADEKKTDAAVDAIVDMMRRAKIELVGAEVTSVNDENMHVSAEKYSLRKEFSEEFDKWMKEKTPDKRAVDGGYFKVGTTSDTLKKIGVRDNNIYWRKQKIQAIMDDHPEITDSIIKDVPSIVERPVIVMKSQTVGSSIVMFGEVMSVKGPVMASVELTPISAGGLEAEFNLITSAYGRTKTNAKNLIENSEIIYLAEKNRVDTLLMSLRVQFPSDQQAYDSVIGSISYKDGNVNISGKKIFSNEEKNDSSTGKLSLKEKDAEYLKAVEAGDTNAAQRMVDEAAREIEAGEAKYSQKDITADDVKRIREIAVAHSGERVSINDFTSEDIQRAEKWARKFDSELGTKSPFFRASFGDWRAYDTTKINTVTVDTIDIADAVMQNGNYKINDTGWTVYAGRTLNKETAHYAGREKVSVKALTAVKDILKNAVLLDTEVSNPDSKNKSPNTAFMHKLYAPFIYDGQTFIAKITVEEFYNEETKNTDRKAYHLQGIKIESAGGRFAVNTVLTPMPGTDSINSISDLFELVKTYDKEFHPKSVNPAMLNEDGTPKVVYHGTASDFWAFDIRKSNDKTGRLMGLGAGKGKIYLTEHEAGARAAASSAAARTRKGSERVMPLYVSAKKVMERAEYNELLKSAYEKYPGSNPREEGYDYTQRDKAIREVDRQIQKQGYDAVFDKESGELFVFNPTQLKSATDNIGTFDGSNPDVRYSLKKTSNDAKTAELEKEVNALRKEIDRIENGGVLTGGTVPSPTKMKKLVDGLFEGYAGEKTKRALSDELSEVYAKMVKYAKMQNGAAKDEAWAKISEKLGDISADICRGLLGSEISDATERLNLYSADMSYAVEAQKVEIMCELFEMPNYITAADKIEALKAEKADALKKVREQRAKTVKALKLAETTDAEIDQKYYESEARKKLLHIARRLGRVKGNASQALIDEFVRGAVDCISSLKELDTVSLGMRTSTKEYLRDLSAWYSEQKRNADFYGDERTEAELARLSKLEINQMSIHDVEALTEALMNVENTIRTQNKLIDSEDKRNFQEQGGVVINDVNHLAGINKGLWDEIVTQSLSPIRAISRITGYNDSDPLMMRTRELNDGQRNMLSWIVKYKTMFNEFTTDTEYMKKLTGKNADIVLRSGDGIMTRGMLISLYLHSMNSQNMKHIELGGAVLPNAELYKAGKIRDAYARKTILKMSRSQIINLANEHLSERDFAFAALIKKYFNVEAKAGINEVSNKLLGYDLAKVGEYFPISVNGAFTKAEYEQIKCDGSVAGMGNLKERTDSSLPIDLVDATTVLNRAIELNAKYIGLAVPVRNMSKLLRIAKVQSGVDISGNVVLEKILGGDGFEHYVYDTSVMDAIERKWGANASDYIKKMLADVQGLNVKDRNAFTDLFDGLRSNYAQAVLTLNPGVAIKQTASFPTAAAVIGWKPLIKALRGRRVNIETVSKYTPLLAYRSLGYTDADLGAIVQRRGRLPKGLNWIQTMDVLTTKRLFAACEYYIEDTKPNLKRWSEEYYKAVAEVYNRVIEETQPNYTAMQRPQMLRSNDTLLKNLAMFKTQPMQNLNLIYDAVGNYRAKKSIMMQDPTAENKAAFKEAGTRLGRVISSQIVQAAMMAAITLAWNAARGKFKRYTGDNDDENVLQGRAFARMMIDVVENLVSGFPGASEITSFCEAIVSVVTTGQFSYYGIEAATPAMISDAATSVLDAAQELYRIVDGTASTEKVVRSAENLAGEIGKMFGVPIGNVDNIVKIIFRAFGVEW